MRLFGATSARCDSRQSRSKKICPLFKADIRRFEDAVINRLGGCPLNVSEVAQNVSVSSGKAVVIEARHLTKRYGSFTAAQDITFQIKRGEIFGLLGPNGAGKSTSFKMMCGLSKPTSGAAFIQGINMREEPSKARAQLGYMAQKFSLFSPLTVLQNLTFFSGIYGLADSLQKEKIKQMVDVFSLQPYLTQPGG